MCSICENGQQCVLSINEFCYFVQIYDDHKRCEIDPAKLREGESLEGNLVSY